MEQHHVSHFKLSATSCGTCGIHFDNPETRRAHSKSRWHVTNLKRRIAEREPLTAEQFAATEGSTASTGPASADEASEESSSSVSDVEVDSSEPVDDFVPERCLFCNTISKEFDENITHMHKAHGMFIPDTGRLAVHLETLVRYLHLVVYGYNECLQCGTQRRTSEAVQQHMIGKNHCRFDIDAEDSEYRDFYDSYSENEEDEDGENSDEEQTKRESQTRKAIRDAAEDGSFRSINLPSGKTISHRSAPGPLRPRSSIGAAFDRSTNDNCLDAATEIDEASASLQLTAPPATGKDESKALARAAERQQNLIETQLARLSVADRAALAHLPAAEQRSVLLAQQRQMNKSNRADRRLQTRLEMKANKTSQGNFVHDVMGPRFSVHLYGSNTTVLETQLARLSVNDRNALAHLPAAGQRSVLTKQQKQLGEAERAGRRLQTRLEMKANKTGQGNFVNDVPGRKNG